MEQTHIELKKDEFEVLFNIVEGCSDTHQLQNFTETKLDRLKEIMNKLEGLGLIVVVRKYDDHYKEDFWDAKATERVELAYEKYKDWLNELSG